MSATEGSGASAAKRIGKKQDKQPAAVGLAMGAVQKTGSGAAAAATAAVIAKEKEKGKPAKAKVVEPEPEQDHAEKKKEQQKKNKKTEKKNKKAEKEVEPEEPSSESMDGLVDAMEEAAAQEPGNEDDAGNKAPRKPHRYRNGTRARLMAAKERKSTNHVMKKAHIDRFIRETLESLPQSGPQVYGSGVYHVAGDVVPMMMQVFENWVVAHFAAQDVLARANGTQTATVAQAREVDLLHRLLRPQPIVS